MATTKTPYQSPIASDGDEDEISERPNRHDPVGQKRIVIEVRQYIGEVIASPNGTEPMVVEAFRTAALYIEQEAAQAHETRVQFDYAGMTFIASCEETGKG